MKDKPMHILYEIEHLSTFGGIERILVQKASYMAEEWGWKVTIIVLLDEPERVAYDISPKVEVRYLHIKSRGVMMCLKSLWKLNKIVNSIKPDVYVTFQTIGAMSCMLHTHHVPIVYEAHGIRTCMQHPLAMTMAERFSDALVVLTDKNAERYGRAGRVVKIPNFTTITAGYAPDYSRKHCVALGRMEYEKNYTRMIALWAKVHKRHPEWILDIYGNGTEKEMLQEQIASLGLTQSVVLHDVTTDVPLAFSKSSICLMTSLFEGLPMTLMEAASCGIPVIAFDCDDGPREVVENGKTGFLIPYDDDEMFVERLAALMDDGMLRRQMGEAAVVSSRRFMPAPIMEKWRNLFTSIR